MSSAENPPFLIPKRTDASGEHPRFVRSSVMVTMTLLEREIKSLSSASETLGKSPESFLEQAIRTYELCLDTVRNGGTVSIVRQDGTISNVSFKEKEKPDNKSV